MAGLLVVGGEHRPFWLLSGGVVMAVGGDDDVHESQLLLFAKTCK